MHMNCYVIRNIVTKEKFNICLGNFKFMGDVLDDIIIAIYE